MSVMVVDMGVEGCREKMGAERVSYIFKSLLEKEKGEIKW